MPPRHLGLLLSRSLGLGRLLLVAVDHDDAYEGTNHGRSQEGQDDRDTDGPDARREDVMERVARVDKWLLTTISNHSDRSNQIPFQYHTINSVHAV